MTTREKTVTDEKIIAALFANGTLRAAAIAAGISERALYNRMNEGEFQLLYKEARAELLRAAVFNLNNQLQAAINTIAGIMEDKTVSAATRLQAAQAILNNAGKFAQRLQAEEADVITQHEKNQFDPW